MQHCVVGHFVCCVRTSTAKRLGSMPLAPCPLPRQHCFSIPCSGSQDQLPGSGTACQTLLMCGTFSARLSHSLMGHRSVSWIHSKLSSATKYLRYVATYQSVFAEFLYARRLGHPPADYVHGRRDAVWEPETQHRDCAPPRHLGEARLVPRRPGAFFELRYIHSTLLILLGR